MIILFHTKVARRLRLSLLLVAMIGFEGMLSSTAKAEGNRLVGSYFSPSAFSGCYFHGAVYYFEGSSLWFRSESSEFPFFTNVATSEENGKVVLEGDPIDIPVDGKPAKHMKMLFQREGEDLVPVALEVNGQKREFTEQLLSTFSYRSCNTSSYMQSFLLMIGWHRAYREDESFVRFKHNLDGSYTKSE